MCRPQPQLQPQRPDSHVCVSCVPGNEGGGGGGAAAGTGEPYGRSLLNNALLCEAAAAPDHRRHLFQGRASPPLLSMCRCRCSAGTPKAGALHKRGIGNAQGMDRRQRVRCCALPQGEGRVEKDARLVSNFDCSDVSACVHTAAAASIRHVAGCLPQL